MRTKLFIPPFPAEAISRPHLVEQLNLGLARKLSLVMAPAGYGKTTLVTTWLNQVKSRKPEANIVWLSLDEEDNDPRRFFTYLIATLSQIDDTFSDVQAVLLQSTTEEIPVKAIVTSLLNQFVVYGRPIVLVLDDYHEINTPSIHEALSFWLTNQPLNIHLAITSRAEPPFPLPIMRVRREIVEIDMASLSFSRAESAQFLNEHMQLNLSEDQIDQLDTVTEGWVASLQLAALSLQSKDDPTKLIQTFKGTHRYIVDYLVTEVLDRQPAYIRDFLLQTSILERFNTELCQAVTQQVESQQILETLDQSRLFVIPLDDRRHWYRYHHLFAEYLQAELQRSNPEQISPLHERASHWFSDNGFILEAMQHAFLSGNHQLAADLIVENARTMLAMQGEMDRLRQWMAQLPDHLIQASPYLLIIAVWLDLGQNPAHVSDIDTRLDQAEALIQAPDAPYTPPQTADRATEIALARASRAQLQGNLDKAIEFNEQALTLAQGAANPFLKIGAQGMLATYHYMAGNIPEFLKNSPVQKKFLDPNKPIPYARYIFLSRLLDGLRLHGQLPQAETIFQRLAITPEGKLSSGAAMVALSWAEILRERNELDQALDYLLPALELLKPDPSMAEILQEGSMTLARILQAQDKGSDALARLQDALQLGQDRNTYNPAIRLSATEAHIQLQRGNLLAAKAWAEKSGLQADDDIDYLAEVDYLVLVRILIADGAAQTTQALLEKLRLQAIAGGRVIRQTEVYILQALAHQALGERQRAVDLIEQALGLGQQAGFIRTFVDEGLAIAPLLKQVARRGSSVSYIQKLLPLFAEQAQPQVTKKQSTINEPVVKDEAAALILSLNPLTDRELTTLRYLARDLTIPQIAEQMVVAPSTIRTYLKRIYSKLDVHNRDEAVHYARALALID
ncbi:MAG: LuxR C-terminal-related transcriptional regulator [Chloroflexota bacterium]